jgi:hypothetical protein
VARPSTLANFIIRQRLARCTRTVVLSQPLPGPLAIQVGIFISHMRCRFLVGEP